MKIPKRFLKSKLFFILGLLFVILLAIVFETKQQWQENDVTYLNRPQDLILQIKNIQNELDSIKCFSVGNNSFLRNDNFYKVVVSDINNKKWYTQMDHSFFNYSFLRDIESFKNYLIFPNNIDNFFLKPFSNVIQFFLVIVSPLSSVIFIFYIINGIKEKSGKLNTNPEVSDKQKSLFTLKDVAGNKEEKEEMKELIDFLNNPHKYQ
ncbi:hypothetical protein AB6A63_01940, partial ['Camptotheca acuminata' phytoplasma]